MLRICDKEVHVTSGLIRIAHIEGDSYEFVENPDAVLDNLRGSGTRVDLFTFMQIMPETSPKYDYPMEWDNLAVLPVSTFDHWWKKQIRSVSRNRARQAEKKGVTLRAAPFNDDLVRRISGIYNECPVRQGRPFPHYGKSIEAVHEMTATFLDSSVFIGAFLGEELIGFVKLTWDQSRSQANLMSIVSMIAHRDKAPTNALIARAVRYCADNGIRHLVYQKFSYGKKDRDTLSDFKEKCGFQRVDLPRYYVPLTTLGRFAFQLGFHHRLVDRIPSSVLDKYREYRTEWYNRGLRS